MTFRERLQLHAFHFDREDKLSDVEMTTQGLWLTVSVARLGLGRGQTQRRPVLCVDDALTLLRTPTAGGVDGPRAVSRWPREEEGTPPAARPRASGRDAACSPGLLHAGPRPAPQTSRRPGPPPRWPAADSRSLSVSPVSIVRSLRSPEGCTEIPRLPC